MKSRALVAAATMAAIAFTATPAGATTMKVNTTADGFVNDDKCGLREAVQAASDNAKEDSCPRGSEKRDVIVLRDQTYNLSTSTNENVNANGDLDVMGGGSVTVRGEGSNKTTVFSTDDDRLFDLPNLASDLRLEKLELSNGNVVPYGGADGFGGNLRVLGGKLTLFRVASSGGEADAGGGIWSNGKITVDRSVLSSHDAGGQGGTIVAAGKTTIKRTEISQSDNTSSGVLGVFGGAVYVNAPSETVNITDSSIRGSSTDTTGAAGAYGGAIYVDAGVLNLTRSELSGNGSNALVNGEDENGGGLFIDNGAAANVINSTIANNQAGNPDGFGGAIYNGGTLNLRHSTLDSNFASVSGDQLYTSGTSNIRASILSGDDSTDACSGSTASSGGFNIGEFDDPGCGYGPDDEPEANLLLNNLADNGGPTQTLALSGGTAVNFVPKSVCNEITGNRDQRGFVRPNKVGGVKQNCDAGAFELGAKKP